MRRKRCKVCRAETGINREGRCPLCQASADALTAGMSYGRWMAQTEKTYTIQPMQTVKPSRMKTCRWCGKQFEVSGHDKAYCCDECREAQRYAREQERQKNARKKQAVKKETVKPPRFCVVCGSSFTPKVGHQLTCCQACSNEYRRSKMRIYKKNQKAREAGNGEKCVFGEASGNSESVL